MLQEIAQAREIVRVPPGEVELVPAIGVARLDAAGPWADKPSACRRQRIARDIERAIGLHIRATPRAGVVQFAGLQLLQIGGVVEVQVQHRAIMFARRDEHRRLAAPKKVVRVVRIQRDRLVGRWSGRAKK